MDSSLYVGGLPARANPLLACLRGAPPLVQLVATDRNDAAQLLRLCAVQLNVPCDIVALGDTPYHVAQHGVRGMWDGLRVLPSAGALLEQEELVHSVAALLPKWESTGRTLVLVTPTAVHVPALARDWVVLRLALPGADELLPLVTAALGRCRDPRLHEPVVQQAAVRALQGLTLAQARRALRGLPVESSAAAVLGQLQREKRLLLGALEVLEVVDELPRLADIGGLDALKTWLSRTRLVLEPEARAFGLPLPKGVLLVGVQGCGKSLTAKASAAALGLPLVRLDIGRLFTARHTPEENLRAALDAVSALAPVVLWVDELDKAFGGSESGTSEAASRVLAALLTWMGEQRGVFVAATANRVRHLPAELLRKGRFDETFFVDVPDVQSRVEILHISLVRAGRDPQRFELTALAHASDKLTGAELEQAVLEALAIAYSERRDVTSADIATALASTVPFVETYDEQVRDLRLWARRHCRPAGRDRTLHELFAAVQSSAGL